MDQNAITLERTTQALTAERAKVAALVEAGQAIVDFDDMDVEVKRPDVFQLLLRNLRAALAKAGV